MSRYQDDTQETAVISDSVWGGLQTIAESTAKITSALIVGILVLHTDAAAASDEALDASYHVTIEQGTLSDTVLDVSRTPGLITEQRKIVDRVIERLRVVQQDSALIADTVIDAQQSVTSEIGQLTATVLAQRTATTLVSEHATLHDVTLQAAKVLVVEDFDGADAVIDRLRAAGFVAEIATLTDEVVDIHQATSAVLTDLARISDEMYGVLTAVDIVYERAIIEDATPGSYGDAGQAWTANVDSWAMSRYGPYTFNSIAVIDGVAYGMTDKGVFALSGGTDTIAGRVDTGKIDLSGRAGELVHPLQANLEYETDGRAFMDVTTTQSGAPQTYTYALPAELATSLTNGRFVFGKGLRGRHFKFSLRLEAQAGYINDLRIQTAPTKRRV